MRNIGSNFHKCAAFFRDEASRVSLVFGADNSIKNVPTIEFDEKRFHRNHRNLIVYSGRLMIHTAEGLEHAIPAARPAEILGGEQWRRRLTTG